MFIDQIYNFYEIVYVYRHLEYHDGELSKIEVTTHDIENSTLNPLAQEFFPSTGRLK